MKHPALKKYSAFTEKLQDESPRGQVLIAAELINDLLRQMIKGFLLKGKVPDRLFKGYGPLSTFSSRADIARALGLITENEYSDICHIREIRNQFAHDLEASFEMQKIKDRCAALICRPKQFRKARGQFNAGTNKLILDLVIRVVEAEQHPLVEKQWFIAFPDEATP